MTTTIKKKLISYDGQTIKYVHFDGSENTIKIGQSCSGDQKIDRKKAVLFVSSSVGCTQGCRFCFLTEKGMAYKSLSAKDIIKNCTDIIYDSREIINDKFLKISFMGMGDILTSSLDIYNISISIFDYSKNYTLGVDGVDIGTSFPYTKNIQRIYSQIDRLNDVLFKERYPLNIYNKYAFSTPHEKGMRTPVRLFVSMPSINPKIKYTLMPRSEAPNDIYSEVARLYIDIIFHLLFLDGINDSPKEINNIIEYFTESQYEVRLLRYNRCPGSMFEESWRIERIIDTFKKSKLNFKYQTSPGSEIMAACGMFICER